MPAAERINFYENQNEASMRLKKTIVLYEGKPYYVIGITDHINDGKLRIYLDELTTEGLSYCRFDDVPSYSDYSPNHLGPIFDDWIEKNPDKGIIRKYLGSAGFNKFRPFPLGNINVKGLVVYVERTPTRNTFQGLRQEALISRLVTISPQVKTTNKKLIGSTYRSDYPLDMFTAPFYNCIVGDYPSFTQVMEAFDNPDVINSGVAFHREFSVLRGPLNMFFLCYKTEGIGIIPAGALGGYTLQLSKDFEYLKETIQELNIFFNISIY